MKSDNNQTDNFYSVEMDKAGEEFLICYWCFDTLEEAQEFLTVLKNGCTALPVTLSLYDAKQKLLEAWKIGDEFQPSERVTPEPEPKTF
jgi:hypothetical protein